MKISIDWFSCTFKNYHSLSVSELRSFSQFINNAFSSANVSNIVFPDDFAPCRGWYGYPLGLSYQGISVFFGASEDMGIYLQISGQGCTYLSQCSCDFFQFLKALYLPSVHVTRLDLALDLFNGELDLGDVDSAVSVRNLRSNWRSFRVIRGFGECVGTDIQLGSRASDLLCRIYDKARQMKRPVDEYWVRVELQLRREVASSVLSSVLELCHFSSDFYATLFSCYRDFLCSCIDFIAAHNPSRCPLLDWWSDFLQLLSNHPDCCDVSVAVPRKRRDPLLIERFLESFQKQCGQRVATFIRCFGLEAIAQYAACSDIYRADYNNLIVECEKKRKESVCV